MSISMPTIEAGNWVRVGNIDGIVQEIYPQGHSYSFWFVYLNKYKPTKHPVVWNGKFWAFAEIPGYYGSYAKESEPYVWELKQGRSIRNPIF